MSGAYANGILAALTDYLATASFAAALMDQGHNQAANWKEDDANWDDVVADIYGATSEQALDSVIASIDTALDQVEITCSAEVFASVAVAGADVVDYVVVFDDTPAADADKSLISTDDGGSGGFNLTPNGSNITWSPDGTNGFIYYDYGS